MTTSGVLNIVNTSTVLLSGIIPKSKYYRIRSVTTSGTVVYTAQQGQIVLF